MRTVLLTFVCLVLAAAEEGRWVSVDYVDHASDEVHYFMGRVDPAVLEQLTAPGQAPAFIRLEQVCYFELAESGEMIGVISYADHQDSGVLLIPRERLLQISLLADSPEGIVAAERRQRSADAATIP